jgi:hypothetical protein
MFSEAMTSMNINCVDKNTISRNIYKNHKNIKCIKKGARGSLF